MRVSQWIELHVFEANATWILTMSNERVHFKLFGFLIGWTPQYVPLFLVRISLRQGLTQKPWLACFHEGQGIAIPHPKHEMAIVCERRAWKSIFSTVCLSHTQLQLLLQRLRVGWERKRKEERGKKERLDRFHLWRVSRGPLIKFTVNGPKSPHLWL